MSGFNGTGPMGKGSMTGGGRGFCSPYGRGYPRKGFNSRITGAGGRGRGNRNMYWPTGLPGWMRGTPLGYGQEPYSSQLSKEQEIDILKDRAAALNEDIAEINLRLRELESAEK